MTTTNTCRVVPGARSILVRRRPALPVRGRLNITRAYKEEEASQAPHHPAGTASNQLEALKSISKVVADTGDLEAIKKYQPYDATTNPSLVLKAISLPDYKPLLAEAIAKEKGSTAVGARPQALVADRVAVRIGCEVLKLVPGRVSTEVDAHLSCDTRATVDKALHLLDLYSGAGVEPSRVYIKIASTWEGIRACEELQKQGVDCNMTLLFSYAQALACADAGAALVSPFVGRIMDWYKAKEGRDFSPEEDPGVQSVQRIYKYYKMFKYDTIVMAASFRNIGEIRQLAGCDNITISPSLLAELEASTEPLPRMLWPDMGGCTDEKTVLDAAQSEHFHMLHGNDRMAVDKLAEGIEGFSRDQAKLEEEIARVLAAQH